MYINSIAATASYGFAMGSVNHDHARTSGSILCFDNLPSQIINHHIPSYSNPTPSKPPHLTLMSPDHSILPLSILAKATDKQQYRWAFPPFFRTSPCTDCRQEHSQWRIEKARVLSQDICCRQSVHVHGRSPSTLPRHQAREPSASTIVERDVVRMGRNAMAVEC